MFWWKQWDQSRTGSRLLVQVLIVIIIRQKRLDGCKSISSAGAISEICLHSLHENTGYDPSNVNDDFV